jgi:hypothetical protein
LKNAGGIDATKEFIFKDFFLKFFLGGANFTGAMAPLKSEGLLLPDCQNIANSPLPLISLSYSIHVSLLTVSSLFQSCC